MMIYIIIISREKLFIILIRKTIHLNLNNKFNLQ